MKIKGAFGVFLIVISIFSCRSQSEQPQRTYEGGVEIVNNGLEPYVIKGEASHLRLEKSIVIDFEDLGLAAVVPKITGFDVDSKGNIYVWSYRSSENFIFKFEPSGKLEHSFGRSGEGPGEIGALSYLRINEKDEIIISDYGRNRLTLMTTAGNAVNETKLLYNLNRATLLANGKLLAWREVFSPEEGIVELRVVLCDKELNELAILGPTEKLPNWARARRINGVQTTPTLGQGSISKGHIYIGNKQSGYQVSVYDLDGNLFRKIRKEYHPVAVPEDLR